MPSVLYPLPIAIVAGLIALPIVIHFINLMRHHKVHWAAMEFLLVSQKRNRTWVMLKQLLLLLLRVAVVAAVVAMVMQPVVQSSLAGLFGGGKVHSIVLLDDSFSMSDGGAESNAFREAKQLIARLGDQAAQQPARQQFTLLRFSKASRSAKGTEPDMVHETVDAATFPKKLADVLQPMRVSQTSVGPAEAVKAAVQLVGENGDQNSIVYIVSDFRSKDWSGAAELDQQLKKLSHAGASLQLVNCVETMRPNLAITGLRPGRGPRAAGVPLEMEITVHNFGLQAVDNVSVRLEEQGAQRPAIEIDRIEPGRSVTRSFEVRAPQVGQRRISAYLPADAVFLDNVRHTVIDFPSGVPVLIIDGDLRAGETRGNDGYFIASALLQPGSVSTGLRPRVESPRYLDDHALDEFGAIYLCNIDRLPASAVGKLTEYVEAGGGLAFFVGERSSASFLNQLYDDGEGLFPAPVEAPVPLLVDSARKAPDLQVAAHPIFRIFAQSDNPYIKIVNVEKYMALRKGWKPPEGSSVQVVARLRNEAPLVVEKKFGEGRVVAFLTTAAPRWNNWARDNPSFVVTLLELQNHLAAGRHSDPARVVGDPIHVEVDLQKFAEQVEIQTPQEGTADRVVAKAEPREEGQLPLATFADTDFAGVYEVQRLGRDNTPDMRAIAYNVDAVEGNLTRLDHDGLKHEFPEIDFDYHMAGDSFFDAKEVQGRNLSEIILYGLVFLLIGEQLLAYSASYHPARLQGART